jgi:hypothetical protein
MNLLSRFVLLLLALTFVARAVGKDNDSAAAIGSFVVLKQSRPKDNGRDPAGGSRLSEETLQESGDDWIQHGRTGIAQRKFE